MMIGEITQMYSNLQGYTPLECELALLEYISEWEDYGVSHYLLIDSKCNRTISHLQHSELHHEVSSFVDWKMTNIQHFYHSDPFRIGDIPVTPFPSSFQPILSKFATRLRFSIAMTLLTFSFII